jgi:hypothetical protein
MNNKEFKSIISLILVISILFSSSYILLASAEAKKGYITNDMVKVRTTPTSVPTDNIIKVNGSNLLLNANHKVTILETVDSEGDENYPKWCHIKFKYNSIEYEGYVAANFVTEKVQSDSPGVVLDGVPEIYKDYIKDVAIDVVNNFDELMKKIKAD